MLIVAIGGVEWEESVFFKDADPVRLCHATENISTLMQVQILLPSVFAKSIGSWEEWWGHLWGRDCSEFDQIVLNA